MDLEIMFFQRSPLSWKLNFKSPCHALIWKREKNLGWGMTIHLSSIQPHPSLRASYLTVSWDAENVGASHFGIDTSSYQILRNRSLWASISGNCQFQANERSTVVSEELCNDTRQYNSLELKYWIHVNTIFSIRDVTLHAGFSYVVHYGPVSSLTVILDTGLIMSTIPT